MIKSEGLNEPTTTSEDSAGPRRQFYDSDNITEMPEEYSVATRRPSISFGNCLNTLSVSASTPQVGRSRGPSVAAATGLQLGSATIGGMVQPRQAKGSIDVLPQQVLRHADSMRSLLVTFALEKSSATERRSDVPEAPLSTPRNLVRRCPGRMFILSMLTDDYFLKEYLISEIESTFATLNPLNILTNIGPRIVAGHN